MNRVLTEQLRPKRAALVLPNLRPLGIRILESLQVPENLDEKDGGNGLAEPDLIG